MSKHYKLIAIDLSKQIELENLDFKQQISAIGKLEEDNGATMFLSLKKQKKQLLIYCKVLQVSYKMET